MDHDVADMLRGLLAEEPEPEDRVNDPEPHEPHSEGPRDDEGPLPDHQEPSGSGDESEPYSDRQPVVTETCLNRGRHCSGEHSPHRSHAPIVARSAA
jgi:hypothetical protein